MKKLFLFLGVSLMISFVSCKKETVVKETEKSTPMSVMDVINGVGTSLVLDGELNRIYQDVLNPDYQLGINDNPNFGQFSSTSEYDIFIGGKTPENVKVKLNGSEYVPYGQGSWLKQGIEFKEYFGKNVTVEIFDGNTWDSHQVYVPKQVLATKLGEPQSQIISRTGNDLHWTPDANSTTGKIALDYTLYDNDEVGSESGMYKRDILILDDNGTFSLDEILADNNCKKIYFTMVTGNTVSRIINGKKLLFSIASYDHHEYIVQ